MKVALLKSDARKKGGVEKYTLRLAKAFQEKGCDVTILTTGEADHSLMHSFGKLSGPNFLRLKKFDAACDQWVYRNQPDIVFGMDRNSRQTHYRAGNGVHAAYLERRAQTASFWKKWSFQINPLHRTILEFEKQTYEDPRVNALFTNSAMVRDELLKYYHANPKKIHVMHNGVEWHEMKEAFDQWPHIKQETPYQFLFVGNEYSRKGLPQLFQALAKISEPYHLSVVGKERNLKYYEELAKSFKINKRVTFYGEQYSVIPFYQMADALVIPSTYDPFANVTVEALAMGLFVISSKDNGGHEILSSETGSIIPDIQDSDTFATLLSQAIRKPKTVENANRIRNAVSHLDFSNQLKRIVEVTLNHAS